MLTHSRNVWPAVAVCLFGASCSQPPADPGPSYADLVVTYNAELEALDRLETKRTTLIQEFAAATAQHSSGDTLAKLEGLLDSAKQLESNTVESGPADPNAQLDELLEGQGAANEIAGQLLEGLLRGGESETERPEPTAEEVAAIAERKATFDSELARLDAEIAKQKERVERAQRARDAADAASQSSE